MRAVWLCLLLVLAACDWASFGDDDADADGDAGAGGDGDGDGDADTDGDGDGDSDSDADADADGDADADADGDADGDADACDPPRCDDPPDPSCGVDGRLQIPEATGQCEDGECRHDSTPMDCGATGCCVDHCCEVIPSNEIDVGLLEETLLDVVVPADSEFDTDVDCVPGSILGNCEPVIPAASPQVCVCRMDTLSVGTLDVRGTRALALLAWSEVTIAGRLHVVPGVGLGAAGEVSGEAYPAGGSYGTDGGGVAGRTFGVPELVPLQGGMSGNRYDAGSPTAGVGGGAIQITAGERIVIAGTLDAPGGGGTGSISSSGAGSGGGAGGGILVEAPVVEAGGVLAANGGAGGGGGVPGAGSGGTGEDGRPEAVAATGGYGEFESGCDDDDARGASGGAGSVLDGPGQPANADGMSGRECDGTRLGFSGSGAGGGAGRIRVNSIEECACGGVQTPTPSRGALTVR